MQTDAREEDGRDAEEGEERWRRRARPRTGAWQTMPVLVLFAVHLRLLL